MSNVAALAGAYLIATTTLDIAGSYFLDLVHDGLLVKDVVAGIVKSLFFGLIIGLVACYRGLTVKGGAAGVGEATTSSVVTSHHERHRRRHDVQHPARAPVYD